MDVDPTARGLAGRAVIVTGGGGPGIGGTTVRRFAAAGASVVVVDVDREAAEAVAGEVTAAGGRAHVSTTDVGTESGCRQMVDDAISAFGRVDVVVNSATAPEMGPVLGISERGWQRTFDTNSTALWRSARFAVPHMIQAGGGVFVNISSIAALAAIPGAGAYGATKAAMLSITRQLAVELAPHRIRANAIAPGLIRTPNVDSLVEHHGRDRVTGALIGGIGQPDDVAGVAVFLASDDARYINGATITVDGGWYATNDLGGLGFNMPAAGSKRGAWPLPALGRPIPAVSSPAMTDDSPQSMDARRAELESRAEAVAPRLLGLGEEEARSLAEAEGCSMRVAVRDGEAFVLRLDYRPGRITVVVTDGRVTSADLRG